jgi:hypothetical protein
MKLLFTTDMTVNVKKLTLVMYMRPSFASFEATIYIFYFPQSHSDKSCLKTCFGDRQTGTYCRVEHPETTGSSFGLGIRVCVPSFVPFHYMSLNGTHTLGRRNTESLRQKVTLI